MENTKKIRAGAVIWVPGLGQEDLIIESIKTNNYWFIFCSLAIVLRFQINFLLKNNKLIQSEPKFWV